MALLQSSIPLIDPFREVTDLLVAITALLGGLVAIYTLLKRSAETEANRKKSPLCSSYAYSISQSRGKIGRGEG